MSERTQVALERCELAELWPVGWMMPTLLIPFKPIDAVDYERYDLAYLTNYPDFI